MPRLGRAIVLVLLAIACARSSEAADVTLAWDPPGDGLATGFVLYYGTASQSYTQQVNVGLVTSYTVNGLSAGTTYYFAVRSYNAAGVLSGFSEEVSGTTGSPVPTATALSLTSNVLSPQLAGTSVTWSATATGGVTPYQFRFSVLHADQWTVGPWTPASTWTWTPSTPANDYFVRVAVRSAGSTSANGELTQTVPFTVALVGTCWTPDPFAAMGGGTCYEGGWLPPGMVVPSSSPVTPVPTSPATQPAAPVTPPTDTGGCTTPDPFAAMGGGTCYAGGWLPPGMVPPATSPVTTAPAPQSTPSLLPAPSTSPVSPSPGISTCSTPDPFTAMGGGTCYNGGWLPPGMALPGGGSSLPSTPTTTATPGGCLTPDPFTAMGGGLCINGGWRPRSMGGGS